MDEHCPGPKSKLDCNSVFLSVEKITTGTEQINHPLVHRKLIFNNLDKREII